MPKVKIIDALTGHPPQQSWRLSEYHICSASVTEYITLLISSRSSLAASG